MAKTNFQTVEDYLQSKPASAQRVLKRLRTLIKKTLREELPGTQECISYQIPAYKFDGKLVIYCAVWSEHFSLYPATRLMSGPLKKELEPYRVSKGTLKFPLDEPFPAALVERIVRQRASELRE